MFPALAEALENNLTFLHVFVSMSVKWHYKGVQEG